MTVNNLCDLVGKVSKCVGNGRKRDYVLHEGRYLREGVYLWWNKEIKDTLTWNQMLGSVSILHFFIHAPEKVKKNETQQTVL